MPVRPEAPAEDLIARRPLGVVLADHPFPGALTAGHHFRDRMRAIHHIAPDRARCDLLEVTGGRSGLSKMLYPEAGVVNLDFDPAVALAPANRQPGVS